MAGLLATTPDMRVSVDRYYDETRMFDIRVVSTLGLTEADAAAIRNTGGVKGVMPSRTADALCGSHRGTTWSPASSPSPSPCFRRFPPAIRTGSPFSRGGCRRAGGMRARRFQNRRPGGRGRGCPHPVPRQRRFIGYPGLVGLHRRGQGRERDVLFHRKGTEHGRERYGLPDFLYRGRRLFPRCVHRFVYSGRWGGCPNRLYRRV